MTSLFRAIGEGWRRAARRPRRRLVPPQPPAPRAELWVAWLLLASAAFALAFVVVYAIDSLRPHQTQLLGLTLGLAFGSLAAAFIVLAKRLVPDEQLSEPYPVPLHEAENEELEELVAESGERITRKRLLLTAGGAAGAALGAALLAPAVSFGPVFDTGRLRRTPWRPGIRLVDEHGKPLLADEIVERTFYTAYPEGADREDFGAPLVIVRLEPAQLDLPDDRSDWAPEGLLAYSKICTHAGCALSLYRTPLNQATSRRPALVCPCHYSTFDPATGGTVLFGPAGRPLPQLPLELGTGGELRAAGGFSSPPGPSWLGVRRT